MSPGPWFFLVHGITWTALGTIILVATWWLFHQRAVKNAAARHAAWTMVFFGLAVLPMFQVGRHVFFSRSLKTTLKGKSKGVEVSSPAVARNPVASAPAECHPIPESSQTGTLLGTILAGAWLSGTLLVLGRFGVAWSQLRNWKAKSLPFPSEALDYHWLQARSGISGDFELRISSLPEPKVPITWGLWHPVVLLPRAAPDWSRPRLEAVVLHELGHVRRRDHATQLLALLVCAIHWFNPVFWRSARKMESDAEIAADDFAILAGFAPSTYAAELLHLASYLRPQSQATTLVETSMDKPFTLENRIRSIIDPASNRGPVSFWSWVGVQCLPWLLVLTVGFLPWSLFDPPSALPENRSNPSCIAPP